MSDDMKSAELKDFPVTVSLPVQWGDQDAFGHVNNAVPIRWMESARIAYFDQAGLRDLMSKESLGIILASITCHYRKQITFPDTVTIGARVERLGNTSITMEHAIHSEQLGELAGLGTCVVVVFDYSNNKPVRIPDSVRETIARVQGTPGM